jgi:hypothetical protein
MYERDNFSRQQHEREQTMGKNEPGLPVDTGKRVVEVLPGVTLATYSKGYTALRLSGKGTGGRKVNMSRVLYRDGLLTLANALLAEAEGAPLFDDAHHEAVETESHYDGNHNQ